MIVPAKAPLKEKKILHMSSSDAPIIKRTKKHIYNFQKQMKEIMYFVGDIS
jgi:hypothetical protein